MKRWLACLLGCLALLSSLRAEARLLPEVNVAALALAGLRLYVGGFDQGLFVVEPGQAPRRLEAPGLSEHINALAWSDSQRVLWVGTARGLVRCQHETALNCRRFGPPRAVHALLVRKGGEVLAGGEDGLLFVRGEATRAFGKKQRAPFRAVWALAERAGQLYVGATNGLFWSSSGASWERASVVQGSLPDDWVTALLAHGDALYVGTYNAGVSRFVTRAGKLVPDGTSSTPAHVNPAGIVALSDQELAVCSMEGLWKASLTATGRTAAHTGDVTAVVPAPAGQGRSYWLGTRRGLELVAE